MDGTLSLRVENRLAGIAPTLDRVDAFLAGHGADRRAVFRVRLALDELLTNVVTHGFPDGGPHEIALELEVAAATAVCRISDDGVPFDPLAAAAPDIGSEAASRPPGGFGLHLVRQTVPEMSYRYEGGRNVLRLAIPLADGG